MIMTGEGSTATNRPLSCHHCRKRKVACDKVLPCQPCQYSGLTCVFPSGRKQTPQTGNSELLRRIARLEQLIHRSGIDTQESAVPQSRALQDLSSSNSDQSPQSGERIRQGYLSNDSHDEKADASEHFVGHSFIKSLAHEASSLGK